MGVVSIGALTGMVRERAPGAPLERIEAALAVSEELTAGADELIGYFVAEARQAGCSWTEIGQRIGVSKQAARQRFAPGLTVHTAGLEQQPRRRRRGKAAGQACSFCGKPPTASLRLIAGPGVWICAECINLCAEILAEDAARP